MFPPLSSISLCDEETLSLLKASGLLNIGVIPLTFNMSSLVCASISVEEQNSYRCSVYFMLTIHAKKKLYDSKESSK